MDVDEAMGRTPRVQFLPRRERRHAGDDRPLPIGAGQTNSQPSTVRRMLELLDLRPGLRVLDVGCGSGWTTALLARLVDPDGSVLGVELHPGLADWGARNVAASGAPAARVVLAVAGVLGVPSCGPYDRILVSAAASHLPTALVDQLADGGVIVLPAAGVMTRVRRHGCDLVTDHHGRYRFVPLRT